MSVAWLWYTDLLRKITRIDNKPKPIKPTPVSWIPSDKSLPTSARVELLSELLAVAYSAVFLLSWNFHFPTKIEQILWRAAILIMLAFLIVGFGCFLVVRKAYFQDRPQDHGSLKAKNMHQKSKRVWNHPASGRPSNRRYGYYYQSVPEIPARWLVLCSVLAALYCVGRVYVLVEDIIGLRSLPSSAYTTVEWTQYLPQV